LTSEEVALGSGRGQQRRSLVGVYGLVDPADAAQQVGLGRVKGVISGEIEGIDQRERARR